MVVYAFKPSTQETNKNKPNSNEQRVGYSSLSGGSMFEKSIKL